MNQCTVSVYLSGVLLINKTLTAIITEDNDIKPAGESRVNNVRVVVGKHHYKSN